VLARRKARRRPSYLKLLAEVLEDGVPPTTSGRSTTGIYDLNDAAVAAFASQRGSVDRDERDLALWRRCP
jgi:hypothetical protein